VAKLGFRTFEGDCGEKSHEVLICCFDHPKESSGSIKVRFRVQLRLRTAVQEAVAEEHATLAFSGQRQSDTTSQVTATCLEKGCVHGQPPRDKRSEPKPDNREHISTRRGQSRA